MGYYTYHQLDIKRPDVKQQWGEEHQAVLKKLVAELGEQSEDAKISLDENGNAPEQTKWYEHDKELLEFSKKHPDIVFVLYGDGDNDEDKWYTYYKNGKMQHTPASTTYDDYDEAKLVEPKKEEQNGR